MGSIAVTGSVAFDTIMVFNGRFADHILRDQAHILNVSFLVEHLQKRRGGTAANVAFTLALLGERPLLCAAVGDDFAEYGAALRGAGVDTAPALVCDDIGTAAAFITTDIDNNQITAFHPGAMGRSAAIDLELLSGVEHVIVGPDAPDAMRHHVEQAARLHARLVFAPAQQLSSMSDETLRLGLDAAWLVVGNDYEMEVVRRRSGRDAAALAAAGVMVARTRGAEGSELHVGGSVYTVPVATPESVVDPTGAGDAYIAGLLTGLREERAAEVAGRMGALAATYVIEQQGPQNHHYTRDEFADRYRTEFGEPLG
jgi:adenosine kinase